MSVAEQTLKPSDDHPQRMTRARLSLDGLSVGDALGEQFFLGDKAAEMVISWRTLPGRPWRWTDDTAMAVSIVEELDQAGRIEQDSLAQRFAPRFAADPNRGYGQMAASILDQMRHGADWRQASGAAFGGQGSMGNGGAMRAGPIGAYFADDLQAVIANARASAEVTHAHPEGQAGAIAVAVAAAQAWNLRGQPGPTADRHLMEAVIDCTPDGLTRCGLIRARELGADASVDAAVAVLGNGSEILAHDTVPFALWCASHCLFNYEEAFWTTVSGLGDRDTNCAIVGSIVALATAPTGIPAKWLHAREPLPLERG